MKTHGAIDHTKGAWSCPLLQRVHCSKKSAAANKQGHAVAHCEATAYSDLLWG